MRRCCSPSSTARASWSPPAATRSRTSCGFLALWQRELQAALPVPVWTSSLLQLAEQAALGRRCGVITIDAASLGRAPSRCRRGRCGDAGGRHHAGLGAAAHADARPGRTGRSRRRSPGAGRGRAAACSPSACRHLVLECTNLPPYAAALRVHSGLPVLDIVTLLNQRMAAQQRRSRTAASVCGVGHRYHRRVETAGDRHDFSDRISAAAPVPATRRHRPASLGGGRLRPVHRRAAGVAAAGGRPSAMRRRRCT